MASNAPTPSANGKLSVDAFGISHVGRVRARNEDTFYIDPQGRFAILADGMGGHKGGKEASSMAVEILREYIENMPTSYEGEEADFLCDFLKGGFTEASLKVGARGLNMPECENMGTTLVVWLQVGSRFYVAHVGDSRAYLVRDEGMFPVTVDHSFGNEQILAGIPRTQAMQAPMRHVLLRNIGLLPPSDPAIFGMNLQPGDRLLICSDGLSNKLTMEKIRQMVVMNEDSLEHTCRSLVEEACVCGGEDNITVILLRAR